jgi:hypothetical protein
VKSLYLHKDWFLWSDRFEFKNSNIVHAQKASFIWRLNSATPAVLTPPINLLTDDAYYHKIVTTEVYIEVKLDTFFLWSKTCRNCGFKCIFGLYTADRTLCLMPLECYLLPVCLNSWKRPKWSCCVKSKLYF